jgi:FtsP/CotA-like multicopper oxidase with cupredoxin domain
METMDPSTATDSTPATGSATPATSAAARPPGGQVPAEPEPGSGPPLGLGGFAVILAVLALVFAAVAAFVGDDSDGDAAPGGGAAAVTVDLSEFALSPAALTVPAGGQLTVTNSGTTAHNLSITGTDLATADLAAGESETLDLSSLEPGDYEVLCTIPGHKEAGMTGTLTVGGDSGGGAAGGGLSAGGASPAAGGHDMANMAGGSGGMTEEQYKAMSDAMDQTIAAYPAETEGAGNEALEPEVAADGTKVFRLDAEVVDWEVEPGKTVEAWTYNGMVPGPLLHVDVGDDVRIELTNDLPMATDLHLHGIDVENAMDGVAPITQDRIEPGDSFTYEFTADEPAVAMYHAHHGGQMQVPNGLLGTLLVGEMPLPLGRTVGGHAIPADLEVSQELPLVLNDSGNIGYSLNGKSFPATTPIVAEEGDWVLVHYLNEGTQIHPMHLHQFDQVVVAKDGFPLDEPYVADTVNVAPGERYSVLVKLDKAGTWVWHCHILNHVERESGMFGMVTGVVVE